MSSADHSKLPLSEHQGKTLSSTKEKINAAERNILEISQELGQRLSSDYVRHQMKDAWNKKIRRLNRETSQNFDIWRMKMLKTLRENPLPAALVGLGVFWLMKNSAEERSFGSMRLSEGSGGWKDRGPSDETPVKEQVNEYLQEKKDQAYDHLSDLKKQAGQKTEYWKEEAGEKMREAKGYVMEQTHYAKGELQHLMENNPLAVGGVMVAIGATIAATLPNSRKENQWMGDSKEKVVEAVKSTVQTTVEEVKREAEKLTQNAPQESEVTASQEFLQGKD